MLGFDHDTAKQSQGNLILAAYCDLPPSQTGDEILLSIWHWEPPHGGTPTLSDPVASAVTGVLRCSAAGVKVYSFPGGTVGPAHFTFSPNPCSFHAFAINGRDFKSSSPYSSGYSASQTGFSHTIVAGANAPFAGAVFFGVASVSSVLAFGVRFVSPDNIFEAPYENSVEFPAGAIYKTGGSLAIRIADAANDAGSHTWTSITADNRQVSISRTSAMAGFWISPSQAPSAVSILSPLTGQLYTIGRTIEIAFTAASDSAIASSSLTYDIEYSLNEGNTWVTLTTTSPGVTGYSWSTTGLAPSTQVQVRVRADNGTETGPWVESGVFSLLVDAAPLAPLNVLPTGIVNQQENLTITFTFNDPGDLQKTLEVQWSTSPTMSSPSTTGTITTADPFYTFGAGVDILASAVPIYYRVRNQGEVDSTNGAWSSIKQILVTAPIAAPNITAPTAGSPPTAGTVTGTFTGTGHVKISYRILQGATPLYESGEIFTSANSFPIAISFANGVAYTLFLKRAASDGLWSAEDSETFTPSYTGPAQPGLTATPINVQGLIELICENSDSPVYQDLFVDDVLIATNLPPNFVFNYAGAPSGVEVTFRVRAYITTTFGFTDSDEVTATQELERVFLFEPTKESATANFVLPPIAIGAVSNEPELATNSEMVSLRKRPLPVTHYGRGSSGVLSYSIFEPLEQIAAINQIEAWTVAGANVCCRDNRGNKANGKIISVVPVDWQNRLTLPLTVTEDNYEEAIT